MSKLTENGNKEINELRRKALEGLEEKLNSGKKLRIKFGADPSRPDLHIGHSVPLRILKLFSSARNSTFPAKEFANFGKNAFADCYSLASVELSENLALLGTEAFYGCKSLQELTIPSSVVGVEIEEGTIDLTIKCVNRIEEKDNGINIYIGKESDFDRPAGCDFAALPGRHAPCRSGGTACLPAAENVRPGRY